MIELKSLSPNVIEDYNRLKDADIEFVHDLVNNDKHIKCLYDGSQVIGYVQIVVGRNSYIYLYIKPQFRHKGYGSQALKLCEDSLPIHKISKVTTTYCKGNTVAEEFAYTHGYVSKFSSAYMKYEGAPFSIEEQPIRLYRVDDYLEAHDMYAIAFHNMRVNVGDFPDSIIEPPSEAMSRNWAATAHERFVYIKDQQIVGYAHVVHNEICSISIHPQFQRQGIGRKFLKYLCNEILAAGFHYVFLCCVVGNNAHILYDEVGFRELYIADFAEKKPNE